MRGGFGRSFGQQVQQQQRQHQQRHVQRMQQGAWWTQQQQSRQRIQQQHQQASETAGAPRRVAPRPPAGGVVGGAAFGSHVSSGGAAAARVEPAAGAPRVPGVGALRGFARLVLWTAVAVATLIAAEVFVMPLPIAAVPGLAVAIWIGRLTSGRKLVGEARQIQLSHEQDALGAASVLRFRVDRYDSDGNRKAPVPVEVRGGSIRGSLHDGDWVEVTGRPRARSHFRARRIRNLTTGERVRPRRRIGAAIGLVIGWTVLLAVFGGIAIAIANA